ncbi:uncharacterized protein LOC132740405 [Ruditapes philippinarum]|uniref:uncharacterized protein LOC132740405 n=1 Tax=Ruditapes philippinarum TaxID=129788 RepID=UPI00295B90F2|nr:uncharacterized protein LOC132740405 [Ruditapes philippinarum]
MYLSKIFCSVVKRLLVETDFPVKNGLAGCHASLLFVEHSEDLHIEMHVSPREGYTIKEKILRVLSEGVLRDMMNSLQTNEIQTSTTVNAFPTEHSTLSGINFGEYETTTNQQSRVVNDNNIYESTPVPRRELVNQTGTAALPVLQDTTTEGHTTSVSGEADNNQNIAADGKEINVDVTILPSNFENPTTLPPIIMPKETEPAIILNSEHLKTYETSTGMEATTVLLDETTKIPETTSTTVTVQRSDGPIFKTQDSVTDFRSFTSTETPKDKVPWLIEPVPVVTKLFNPVPVDIANNIFNGSSRIGLPNIRPPLKQKESPKIVESLMAGGVMKLPFKTNSNFRFLFSSDSKMKPVKQNILSSPGVEIKVKSDNAMDASNTDINNKAFNSQNIKYSRTEVLDLFTERPKSLKILRTLRAPTSSTKSVVQRKADLQKNPKRAIDVTEFGTQRLVLKV